MQYGLVYQVLSCIDRALVVSTENRGRNLKSVTLTVEPQGGDLVEADARERHVYQFKARGDRRAWSLNQLIDEVLPDLYRASADDGSGGSYSLVTEGREGALAQALSFFARLATIAPELLPGILDDNQNHPFFPRHSQTEREFFSELVQRIAVDGDSANPATVARVKALLGGFRIHRQTTADVRARATSILQGFVGPEQVANAINTLSGVLLEWGAEGDRRFTVEELLRAAGLPTTSIGLLPLRSARARARLEAQLCRSGYDRSIHVGRPVDWPDSHRVLCLTGESGMGKTSLLTQLADRESQNGRRTVVFVPTGKSVELALQLAADEVWQEILENDSSAPLKVVAKRAARVVVSADTCDWLSVFLDITATDEAIAEILALPWEEWRVRVAFTADATAERSVELTSRSDVITHRVTEFTQREIRQFFDKRGIDWRPIPDFVIEPLRRHPILAHVYTELDEVGSWRDTSEYELFRRFWSRLHTAPGQSQHPNDTACLLRLTDELLERPEEYPWPCTLLERLRIDDATRMRLQKLGWLRNLADGGAEFPHDRLMNWAVAETLVERMRSSRWTADEVGSYLAGVYDNARIDRRRFGFVPMDALAIAVKSEIHPDAVATILEKLERPNVGVYERLLPTLGRAIVPALLAQIKRLPDLEHFGNHRIRACIRTIERRERPDAAEIAEMLNDSHAGIQRVGIDIATSQPNAMLLDRLWQIRSDCLTWPDDRQMVRHMALEAVRGALEANVRTDPTWITRRIEYCEDGSQIAALLKLLASVADDRGRANWLAIKRQVLVLTANDRVVSAAARCIGRFRDVEEAPWLENVIRTGSAACADKAFAALAAVDPESALGVLETTERIDDVAWSGPRWLHLLLAKDREATLRVIGRRMKTGDLRSGAWYWEVLHRDSSLLNGLVEAASERLTALLPLDTFGEPESNDVRREIDRLVELLASVFSVEAITALACKGETSFGMTLAQYTARRDEARAGDSHRFLENAHALFLRVGGTALEAFLLAQLEHRDRGSAPSRIRALQAAPVALVLREVPAILSAVWDIDRGDEGWPERGACIETLAAFGDRRVVMRAAEEDRLPITDSLLEILEELAPASDEMIAELLDRLDQSTPRARVLWALAFSGREAIAGRMIDETVASGDSETKNAARCALNQYLPTSRLPLAALHRLRDEGEVELYRDLLFSNESDEAKNALVEYLLELPIARITNRDAALAAYLANANALPDLAVVVWNWAKRHHRFLWEGDSSFWSALGYVDDDEARDLLLGESFGVKASPPRAAAIHGLARRNQKEAFEAAHRLLIGETGAREQAPILLSGIDEERAIHLFGEHLPHERNVLVRTMICIALRSVTERRTASEDLIRMLISSGDAPVRAAGCELAGYVSGSVSADELRERGVCDEDPMVQSFAMGALALREVQKHTADLLGELVVSTGALAWAYVDALIESSEPFLLNAYADPLSLAPALRAHPGALRAHARERLAKRLKEVVDRLNVDMRADFYR